MSESEITVTPLNAQVVLFASEGAEFPEWMTGDELAVATDSAIMVATRADLDGDVTVRVLVDEVAPQGEEVFEGEPCPRRIVPYRNMRQGKHRIIPTKVW